MSTSRLAVVTGASGLLGGNLAVELLRQGHRVRATRRGQSKVAHLDGQAIEWVSAELSQPDALERAFAGADVVFHCAAMVSIRRKPTPEITAANVAGTRNVLEAFGASKARRLVHCSTVGAIGLSEDGKPCTETARWNFAERGMGDGYVTTKHQAQALVVEAAARGLDAVIVNPTYMLGPLDSKPSSGKLIVDVVRRKVPGWTTGVNNFVDVRDVARGMILAWEKGKSGEKYILGGENLTYRAVMEQIASAAGVRAPSRQAPRWLTRLVGWGGDLRELLGGGEPLINSSVARYAYCPDFQFSSEKATRELGYSPGPLEPAIRDALTWFRAQRMLS